MATCFGADIATLVQPPEPAPGRVIIGPRKTISVADLEIGTFAFYRTLLRTRDGGQALIDMNAATGGRFFGFTAEWFFLEVLKGYFNESTTERAIAARVEGMLAPLVLAGISAPELSVRRQAMRAMLTDRKRTFDWSYRSFFFVDEHPEIADRFRMTYESCFEEEPLSGQ
jgi:hypothetical protein